MATPAPEELYYAVQRGDQVFQCLGSDLKDKLEVGDVMAVHRPSTGVTHGWKVEAPPMPWDNHVGGVWEVQIPAGASFTPSYGYEYYNLDGDYLGTGGDGNPPIQGPDTIMYLTGTNCDYLFSFTGKFVLGPLTNTHHVTSMSYLFMYSSFDGIGTDFSHWDVRNVEDASYMWNNNSSIVHFHAPGLRWEKLQYGDMMFTSSMSYFDCSDWSFGPGTHPSGMFAYCTSDSIRTQDFTGWDTSGCVNMENMFQNSYMDQDISMWCVQNIASKPSNFDYYATFQGQTSIQPQWGDPC